MSLRKSVDQLTQKHPLTLVIDLDELIQFSTIADSLGISRHALGLRALRLGFERVKADPAGALQQQSQR